ncbi:MAG: hemerythrin domain-containing protein [Acidobacteriota bacterium]|nr:hemerythrin domain-containing protein [Acidobacteriota bacterium]
MDFQFEISRRLSREHLDVTALLARLDKFMHSHSLEHRPDWQNPETRRVLGDLRGALRAEVPNHFAIEEQELFPLYAQEGGSDMVELLLEDHRVILDLADELQPLVDKALSSPDGLGQAEWETFRAKGQAFATELCAHAEKEEFGFVPAMDELLDSGTAKRIFDRYLQM